MPLRKVHELTFLWLGLPGPLLIISFSLFFVWQKVVGEFRLSCTGFGEFGQGCDGCPWRILILFLGICTCNGLQ